MNPIVNIRHNRLAFPVTVYLHGRLYTVTTVRKRKGRVHVSAYIRRGALGKSRVSDENVLDELARRVSQLIQTLGEDRMLKR
ncbi:hypothetical protein [Alicyclobacillus sp. SP_1]|uniref:hypothetical protein n=1 Tax=Alicyclobacillus sp. SP_1 TaxID=2942475 RepID=UPI0021586691|nr:hypothetical protein [Alicyclobacillus sp. SP_1]